MTSHPPTSDRYGTTRGGRGRAAAASTLVAALAAGGLGITLPAQAAVSPGATVVINEVYGGGGNSGATLTHDFVELVNVSGAPVDITGWTLQYASAAGGFVNSADNNRHVLSGTIAAGASFLVQESKGTAGSQALPAPDATGSLTIGGSSGKVALASDTSTVSGPTAANVVDYVAWGSSTNPVAPATPAAGGVAAPATANATSVSRDAAHTNTANNGADFTAGAPSPTNSGAVPTDPTDPTDPADPTEPTDPVEPPVVSIAQIQGSTDTSPLAGQTVTTQGVVTAVYATGGRNGYTIQTSGTGGALDLNTRTVSDALFIYAPGGAAAEVAVGETVQVTGEVSEYRADNDATPDPFTTTQIRIAVGAVVKLPAQPAPTAAAVAWPATDAQRESIEHMLVDPQGELTVTNTYSTNQFGEVGLAAGTTPLRQPTDAARPGTPEAAVIAADNAARAVTLDDGAATNYLNRANTGLTPAYVSLTEPVIVGASATIAGNVTIGYNNGAWRFQPLAPIVGDGTGANDGVSFENTRTPAPDAVGGDVSVASFNVLNYFTTLGDANAENCTSYNDRTGNGNNVNSNKEGKVCLPRGAWDAQDLARQQAKIVAAINTLDASVVGLMEIENSAALGEAADEATASLVTALNAASTPGKWAFVPSSDELPAASTRDVITNAIIYQPALATPVGESRALGDLSDEGEAFGNAREPIAQVFEPAAGGEEFLFVVNHFKSKGSAGPFPGDADTGDGQGASNESRIRQANALAEWVADIQGDTESVFLVGDFNSYGQEDPLVELYDAGYVDAEADLGIDSSSYSFSGLTGSLDHILMNEAAAERATGGDIWNINSGESIALEYSRYNYHGVLFHDDSPYRSSDHDPIKVGLVAGEAPAPGDGHPGDPGGPAAPVDENPGEAWATVTLDSHRVEQGGELEVTVTGLEPGQQIGATLFSEPIVVTGIPAADAAGRTAFTVAIPADFAPGAHELVVTTAGEEPIRVAVTVVADGQLAVTGAEFPLGVALAGGFLLVAAGMVFALRRRSPLAH